MSTLEPDNPNFCAALARGLYWLVSECVPARILMIAIGVLWTPPSTFINLNAVCWVAPLGATAPSCVPKRWTNQHRPRSCTAHGTVQHVQPAQWPCRFDHCEYAPNAQGLVAAANQVRIGCVVEANGANAFVIICSDLAQRRKVDRADSHSRDNLHLEIGSSRNRPACVGWWHWHAWPSEVCRHRWCRWWPPVHRP
jgi:hypothetical protein